MSNAKADGRFHTLFMLVIMTTAETHEPRWKFHFYGYEVRRTGDTNPHVQVIIKQWTYLSDTLWILVSNLVRCLKRGITILTLSERECCCGDGLFRSRSRVSTLRYFLLTKSVGKWINWFSHGLDSSQSLIYFDIVYYAVVGPIVYYDAVEGL
jgi:hypothetical protein